jgi:hypothetical protein
MKITELTFMKEQAREDQQSAPRFKSKSFHQSVHPDYQEDYGERVAILIVDGGLDSKLALFQAVEEIQARYGPDCVVVTQEQV